MPKKNVSGKKGRNDIPFHNQFKYSDVIDDFNESDRVTETELDTLSCFHEYEPEYKLNSLNDSCINDHLYVVFSMKRKETVSFIRTWTGFFVRQHRTKLSQKVQPYLNSKKLSLDEWLMLVKHGCRGDIMLVYVLSIIKGLHMCIHLKNGKTWSTLRAVPIHHEELMSRCDIHLTYFGFGIFLRLIRPQHPIPDILGTIYSDNPSVLKELTLRTTNKACPLPSTKSKKPASAAAGSASDLPRLEHALISTTSPCMPGTTSTEVTPKNKKPANAAAGSVSYLPRLECELINTTSTPCTPSTMSIEATPKMSVTTSGALPGTTSLSAGSNTTSTAFHMPVSAQLHPTIIKQGNIKLHELYVKTKRLTESDIAKYTTQRKTPARPLKLVLHKLPLVPTQSVNVATSKTSSEPMLHSPTRSHTSRKGKDQVAQTKLPNPEQKKTMPKCKISGHPSGDKHHAFRVKCHILRKKIRKLYLQCRITNCKQAF